MANPFDQFDAQDTGNPFDQFDASPVQQAQPQQPQRPKTLKERFIAKYGNVGQTEIGQSGNGVDALAGMVVNAPSSVANFARGVSHMIANPIDTAVSLNDLAVGGIRHVLPDSWSDDDHARSQIAAADAVADSYKDGYGSLSAFNKTLGTDPVRVLMDASIVAGGGGAALSKAGQVSKIDGLAQAGALTSKAGQALDPLQAGANYASQVLNKTGSNISKQGIEVANTNASLAKLEKLKVPITKDDLISSQLTRNYGQQEAERLIAEQPFIGKELAARIGRGQEKMSANLEAMVEGAKALDNPEAAGSAVREWAQNVYGAAKKDTQAMYDYAKQLHGDKQYHAEPEIIDTLVKNRAMPGYDSLFTQAKNMGIIVDKADGGFTSGLVTVKDLDQFKTIANRLTQSIDGSTKYAGGDIVNKLYGQLDNVAPEFREAAALRKRQGQHFEDPKVMQKILGTNEGRFGAEETTVGGITIPNYKVADEKLVQSVLNGSINDVRYLRNMAITGTKQQRTQGVQAIRQMRGAILKDMQATWENTRTPMAKANTLDKYLTTLGNEKIEILFGKAGSKQIKDFQEAAAIMNRLEPSIAGGSPTASRLVNMGGQILRTIGKYSSLGASEVGIAVVNAGVHIAKANKGTKIVTTAKGENALARMAKKAVNGKVINARNAMIVNQANASGE